MNDQFALRAAAALPCPEPLPDPDDEPFLAVAAATGSVLVTGNLRHFPPRNRRGVPVRTPREFVDEIRRRARGGLDVAPHRSPRQNRDPRKR